MEISKTKLFTAAVAFGLLIISCGSTVKKNDSHTDVQRDTANAYAKEAAYDFGHPDKIYPMPAILDEISAVSLLDGHTFAAVQDEKGTIFTYDTDQGKISNEYTFGRDGDYEGIAVVGQTAYVLEAKGVLHQIKNYASDNRQSKTFPLGSPAKDHEGLCYDRENNRLLIGPKSKLGKGSAFENLRLLYAFDLTDEKMEEEPAYQFDLQQINEFINKNNVPLSNPAKEGKSSMIRFKTSAIAVHPTTQELYLISSKDYLLMVFDRQGNIKQAYPIDPAMYNQAEGISFFENGDMLLSNEKGDNKNATVLYLKYQ